MVTKKEKQEKVATLATKYFIQQKIGELFYGSIITFLSLIIFYWVGLIALEYNFMQLSTKCVGVLCLMFNGFCIICMVGFIALIVVLFIWALFYESIYKILLVPWIKNNWVKALERAEEDVKYGK